MIKGECKYYLKGNRCGNVDAPNPNHSRCIGVKGCGSFEYLNPDARLDMYEALKLTRDNLQTLSDAAIHYKKAFSTNLEILNQVLAKADRK